MKNVKKIVAWAGILAIIAMSTAAYAATFNWSVTGWNTNTDVVWDDTFQSWAAVNATWSSTVQVSAYVDPILTMNVSTWAIDFGVLTPWSKSDSLDLTTATNAEGWINISVASNWLASWTRFIWSYNNWAQAPTTWTDTYEINSTTDWAWTDLWIQEVIASQNVLTTNNVADSNQITTVDLTTTIDAQTEAGNYGDTLTFTLTGNF
jgi:hypothetical protein